MNRRPSLLAARGRPSAEPLADRYGTVIQRKEVSGGEVLYWVAWEEEGEIELGDVAVRLIGADTGRRVVKKRPSWTKTRAWTEKEWKEIMAEVAARG